MSELFLELRRIHRNGLSKNINKKKKHSTAKEIGGKNFFDDPALFNRYFYFFLCTLVWMELCFFDYKAGHKLLDTNFVGLKYFLVPFSNPILRDDIVRVLRNTLVMSFWEWQHRYFP